MKRSDSKRQAILDAAYRLFRRRGFDRTSVSEITVLAGGSKATIYSYFPSKEDLFVECMSAAAEKFAAGTFARLGAVQADVGATLQNWVASYLQFACSTEMIAVRRLMIAEAGRSGAGKLFYSKIASMRAHMATFLSECMDSGKLRRDDPVLAADQIRALVEAEMLEPLMLCAREHAPDDAEHALAAKRAVAAFLRIYAPGANLNHERPADASLCDPCRRRVIELTICRGRCRPATPFSDSALGQSSAIAADPSI